MVVNYSSDIINQPKLTSKGVRMSAFITNRKNMVLKDPNFVKTLLNNPISGLLWLVVRVWVGLQWLNADCISWRHRPGSRRDSLKGFWRAPWRSHDRNCTDPLCLVPGFPPNDAECAGLHLVRKLVAFGETAIGIAMILGIFTALRRSWWFHELQFHAGRFRQH